MKKEAVISHVLFSLKVGYYYSNIFKEDVSKDIEPALVESYQVPSKGDIIKTNLSFFDEESEIEKEIEYTLEVQTVHYILDDWGEATITVYANVVNEKMKGDK